ncbi:tetratricopeptide repeat protein [Candidatus Sulfurimonas baltica]|uniref:Tetratricopeptide repeat protein n=1 Tax=Candidatus Sulfurimonas baltica TaxID=2740404 RepID=A0A7S7LUK5_9BACT|nr:tetratricopeptide repeat protein [Candidatus Sulfurimonas baltica]QOY50989.1 tetratricopeptide repeat protein [Candidatus Sulfurimonas baltica]
MARKQKTILGQINTAPAQRQFTDREEPQKSFIKSLADVNNREYSILTYYGVGGIGKSSLQRHLKAEHLDNNKDAVYSSVDFDIEADRVQHRALRILSQNFKSNFKIKFTVFDMAYIIYWSKAYPDHDIKKDGLPFLEEGSHLSSIVDTFADVGGIAGAALNILDYAFKKSKEISFDSNLQTELKNLNTLDETQIEEKLPLFFAHDLDTYKKTSPEKKVVIFLDTYEALWQNKRSDANRLSQDEWIRDFVSELPNVLFVICGREKIRWEEVDKEWKEDLNQHILGNLSEDDAKSFLNSCEIVDTDIQDEMIESSEGLPYYLDLCVDTYYKIKDSGNTPSAKYFSEVGQDEIFERFMRYLSPQEQETLKVLANARFYTKELFSLLIEEFKTGYPVTAMYQLNTFSFIREEDKSFFIHDLMRKNLISFQHDELNQDVNEFLFNHYDIFLQDLDIKNISQNSIEALPEAFYHKEQMGDVKALSDWYGKPFTKFITAAKYKVIINLSIKLQSLLTKEMTDQYHFTATVNDHLAWVYESIGQYKEALPLYKEALKININILGIKHPDTAGSYNNLAFIYEYMGNYDEALFLHKKALSISKSLLGENDPRIATSYNNIAVVYTSIGNYSESLVVHKKALLIRQKLLGEKHLDTATSCNNLAIVYKLIGNYEEALLLFKKAILVREKILGEEHPDTATSYNNIASLLESMGNYDEALPLYKKALAIRVKVLGEKHPDTTTSYNNLAMLSGIMGNL